jgi:hypothetical protein
VSRDLHQLLEDLTSQVISGALDPYPASVAGSLVGVRLRLLEYERKIRETDELLARLEVVEEAASTTNGGGRRWGG